MQVDAGRCIGPCLLNPIADPGPRPKRSFAWRSCCSCGAVWSSSRIGKGSARRSHSRRSRDKSLVQTLSMCKYCLLEYGKVVRSNSFNSFQLLDIVCQSPMILQEEESLVTTSLQNVIDITSLSQMEFRRVSFHPKLNYDLLTSGWKLIRRHSTVIPGRILRGKGCRLRTHKLVSNFFCPGCIYIHIIPRNIHQHRPR